MGTSPGAAVDPLTCSGYLQPRIFLESQAWWLRTPAAQGTSFGHVHIGTCFPHAQKVRGIVTFEARLILHESPGTLTRVTGGITAASGDYSLFDVPVGMTCSGTCERWIAITADTRKVPVDGRVEWRFRPHVREPDGKEMVASTGWQTYLDNRGGRAVTAYRPGDVIIARGWYTDVGYANSTISDLPPGAVSGVWTPHVVLAPGAGGIPVTSHAAHVDPAFHMGNHGLVVAEGPGAYRGKLTIDTRALVNGPHKLVLKASADAPSGSTSSGVLVVPFVVRN